jgi:hypothetical protein
VQQRFTVDWLTVDPTDPDYPAHARFEDVGGGKL